MAKVNVLFVCMGNICRSPTAEGVFAQRLIEEGLENLVGVDSAGTHAYHVGEPPDPRSQSTASNRGISLQHLKARKAVAKDFERFDYVLAMDRDNIHGLEKICPTGLEHKLHLFLSYASNLETDEVPDPYYGGPTGFDRVFDMIEDASNGLLQDIQLRHL